MVHARGQVLILAVFVFLNFVLSFYFLTFSSSFLTPSEAPPLSPSPTHSSIPAHQRQNFPLKEMAARPEKESVYIQKKRPPEAEKKRQRPLPQQKASMGRRPRPLDL